MSKAVRQLVLPIETHRNHYLFSDHFLNQVLPGQDVWRESEVEAGQALDAIGELYTQLEDALPHYNEAALEQEWIRPILDVLGHVYHVQPSLTGAAGTPDYAFFADDPAKQVATPMWGTPAFWEAALAVGDAKRWDRPLDKRLVNGAPDAFTNANPCFQIDYYLRRTGCAWGIVSNGRRWRLYHQDTSFRLDIFYEVDLVQLIEQEDLAAFRYFYLFFRAAAFRPDAEGHCWLDEVLAQSTAYAVRVGDELKGRVYEALRLLAQGFLDYPVGDPEQALDPTTDLPHIHDACLILLYRLLFLLYAESRNLLPLDNYSYAGQYSLKAIKEDIARKTDEGVVYLPKQATTWYRLRTLFDIIYNGQEALGVPAYDGRLFDPNRYPFLEERTIGDKYLAQAIDLLARAEAAPGQGLSFVDYRDLSIRHLGSIYEGLLEYRLAYAGEEMTVVRRGKRGKKEEIVPSSEAGKGKVVERIPAGQVYPVTDRGERKATGSYYTPDYIVKYIVEQTLGPLADAQAEAVESEIAALKAKNKGGARRTKAYQEELARLQNSFADRVLALNTLDPAMGSGHFLVEATDYLARRIVEAGVVTEALANGDEESELSYWRRRVVERCIYGVDLNPLAVELAKLSLWLATVARGKPLSFLDHHLRCGNSLIGARVADLQALPVRKKRRKKGAEAQQLAMWDESAFTQDMYRVVGAMRQIQEYETVDLVSVKEKERLFEETVERERRKWRRVADLWTATYFGLELTPEVYNACVQYVQDKPVLLQAAQVEALLARAHEVWEEKRFFHWEIEFPEVFFDEYGRYKGDAAGFDAVVSNPPYADIKGLDKELAKYLVETYSTIHLRINVFAAFLERVLKIAAAGDGRVGFIIPTAFLTLVSYAPLRELVLDKYWLRNLIRLPNELFGEAAGDVKVDTCIVIVRKGSAPSEIKTDVLVYDTFERIKSISRDTASDAFEIPQRRWITGEGSVITLMRSEEADIVDRMRSQSAPLDDCCEFCLGLTPYDKYTGHTEEQIRNKVFHAKSQLDSTYEKLLLSGDVRRYSVEWNGEDWIKYGEWLAAPREQRFFSQGRILVQQIIDWSSLRIFAGWTNEELYNTQNQFNLLPRKGTNLKFVLAILNSKLMSYYHRRVFLDVALQRFQKVLIKDAKTFPIHRISFTTPPEERERLVEEGQTLYTTYLPTSDDTPVQTFIAARLTAEPEQADVIHDLLAYLAEQMIEMHKEKQVEVRGFLDWLTEYTGQPVDEWVLKTNLRRYYEQDWAEMQRILKRNQRKLPKVDLDVEAYKNEPTAKVRAAWDTSMETLRPLLARIEATDRLIDRIVYQLYGLTEGEIKIVEENGRL